MTWSKAGDVANAQGTVSGAIANRQSSIDNRHQALMAEIDRLYRAYNHDLPPPDMGRVAKALGEFLRANPRWPLKTIQRALRNRFDSQDVNLSEEPWAWIKLLPRYVQDPLNKFRQPQRGRGDQVFQWWEEKNQGTGNREQGTV